MIGSSIGKKSAACTPGVAPPPPPPSAYNDGDGAEVEKRAGYDDPTYGDRYGDARYEQTRREANRDAYRRDSYRRDSYRVTDRAPDGNACTLAESPIFLPDGTVQKRFVRVCPDAAGRYQVVD